MNWRTESWNAYLDWIDKGNKYSDVYDAYEAGANAILKALWSKAVYGPDKADREGITTQYSIKEGKTLKGVLVFIPDEWQ